MIDLLQTWRSQFPPGVALDIGAGDGEISAWLSSQGFTVEALEPDHVRAERLAQQFTERAIQVRQMDILTHPLPEAQYAIIIASAVLHFIAQEKLQPLAEKLTASLVPGGMLFAAVFTVDDPGYAGQDPDSKTAVRHFFERNELSRLFASLEVLFYEESRRIAPESVHGYRSGATLVARRPPSA